MQMGHLDGLGELPPPARQEVVSPSQSAFGLRAYEDEGEDGEGEAPPEVEEDDFEDEGDDDWDTVSLFARPRRTKSIAQVIYLWWWYVSRFTGSFKCRCAVLLCFRGECGVVVIGSYHSLIS